MTPRTSYTMSARESNAFDGYLHAWDGRITDESIFSRHRIVRNLRGFSHRTENPRVSGDFHETFVDAESPGREMDESRDPEEVVVPRLESFESTGDSITNNRTVKRLRVRIPIVRSRAGRAGASNRLHRKIVEPSELDVLSSRRRFVVTKVRALGERTRENVYGDEYENENENYSQNEDEEDTEEGVTKWSKPRRVTITRRRKIQPVTTADEDKIRARVTRKKLVKVRPFETMTPSPTTTEPSLVIITSGFYGTPLSSVDEDPFEASMEYDLDTDDEEDASSATPSLEVEPTTIEVESTEEGVLTEEITSSVQTSTTSSSDPVVILTDHFFLPQVDDEEIDDEEVAEEVTTEIPTLNASDLDSTSIESTTIDDIAIESTTPEDVEINPDTPKSEDSSVTIEINPETSKSTAIASTPSFVNPASASTTTPKTTHEVLSIDPGTSSHQPIWSSSSPSSSSTTSSSSSISLTSSSSPTLIAPPKPFQTSVSIPPPPSSDVLSSSSTIPDIVRYTKTIVTTTRLRTYTYVVTKLNGLETEVTSSTAVMPKVTTLTLTVPVDPAALPDPTTVAASYPGTSTASPRPTSTPAPLANPIASFALGSTAKDDDQVVMTNEGDDEQGRRFNLATRIMSNGVGVIVAASGGPSLAPRWENASPSMGPATLTLSDAMVMLMPRDEPREFLTKTCTTTFAYLGTYVDDGGVTRVSTRHQIVYNTATEERHGTGGSMASGVTLEASPTLSTEVFETTYTYLDVIGSEGENSGDDRSPETRTGSTVVVTNTVTAPQRYLDVILEPSEAPRPETNAYPSTRVLEKTFTDKDGKTSVRTVNDIVTRLVVTESARSPPTTKKIIESSMSDSGHGESQPTPIASKGEIDNDVLSRTYYVTYSYYQTVVEDGGVTTVRTNVATSSDVVTEKIPGKRIGSTKSSSIVTEATRTHASPEPIQIFATKTYLTTFTYFTTLLQANSDGETSTTVSSRSRVVENVVTESIAPSLLEADDYAGALLRTMVRPAPDHVETESANEVVKNTKENEDINNVVTGSTIIFFDEEDQIDSTPTSALILPSSTETSSAISASSTTESPTKNEEHSELNSETHTTTVPPDTSVTAAQVPAKESNNVTVQTASTGATVLSSGGGGSFGSLGPFSIHGLSALGPVITAMAGLLQGTTSTASRRNDTVAPDGLPIFENITHRHRDPNWYDDDTTTTRRSPVYIPVSEFADAGDIETAESQNIVHRLAANLNRNYIPDSRHKVAAASLVDGIPISPGEVITANSDVIIGKPGRMAPRPPQGGYSAEDDHIGIIVPPPPPASSSVPIPVGPTFEEPIRRHPLHRASLEQHRDNEVQEAQIQIVPARQVFEEHLRFTAKKHESPSNTGPNSGSAAFPDDPLLRPPDLPVNRQTTQSKERDSAYASSVSIVTANPNLNDPAWSPERYRRPWSAKDPIETPGVPEPPSHSSEFVMLNGNQDALWPKRRLQHPEHPAWAQKDPSLPSESSVAIVEGSESHQPSQVSGDSDVIRHVVPHVIDRSTGQPLLVNIQPSQVANVVIPQGGNQALIFGDTNEPHISGQYFDDPSPYPEPEIAAGFTIEGLRKETDDSPSRYATKEGGPSEYMVPPHSSPSINFQQLSQTNSGGPGRFPALLNRPGYYPTRTEIQVHPGSPTRGDHPTWGRPGGQGSETASPPPRRTESEPPPRRYVIFGKRPVADSRPTTNDLSVNVPNWKRKPDKKTTNPNKIPLPRPPLANNRRQPPPPLRPPGPVRPNVRKPSYIHSSLLPPTHGVTTLKKPDSVLVPPHRTPTQTPFGTNVGVVSVDHLQRRPQIPLSSQHQILRVNATSGYVHDTEFNVYQNQNGNSNDNSPVTESSLRTTKQENVPTGAVGYHDPSKDPEAKPVDAAYYPRLPTIRPEVHSFGQILVHSNDNEEDRTNDKWRPNTQTERPASHIDSELSETQDTESLIPHLDHRVDIPSSTTRAPQVTDVPVVHGIPFHSSVYETVNTKGIEKPIIVVGKPFGVYGGETQRPTNDGVRDILVHQGVPFGYQGNLPNTDTSNGSMKPTIIFHPYQKQHQSNRSPVFNQNNRPGSSEFPNSGVQTSTTTSSPSFDAASSSGTSKTGSTRPSSNSQDDVILEKDIYYDEESTPELTSASSTYYSNRGDQSPHLENDGDDVFGNHEHEFSLAVDTTGEDAENDAQTERPPSMFSVTAKTTGLGTTNTTKNISTFDVTTNRPREVNIAEVVGQMPEKDISTVKVPRPRPRPPVPNRDMMPPPLNPVVPSLANKNSVSVDTVGLEPPPLFSNVVVGLSPPPLAPVTPPANVLAPTILSPPPPPPPSQSVSPPLPPKYIPFADSTIVTASRPFLVQLLSQDMIPPAMTRKTLRPVPELPTIRPTIAVSGSIQLATVETTSRRPIYSSVSRSKIPNVRGTTSVIVESMRPEQSLSSSSSSSISPSTTITTPEYTRSNDVMLVNAYTINDATDSRPVSSRTNVRYATLNRSTRPPGATSSNSLPSRGIEPSRSSTMVSATILPSRPFSVLTTASSTTKVPFTVTNRPTSTVESNDFDDSIFLQPSKNNNEPSGTVKATEALSELAKTTIEKATKSKSTTTTMKSTTTTEKAPRPVITIPRPGKQPIFVPTTVLRTSLVETAVHGKSTTLPTRGSTTLEPRPEASVSVVSVKAEDEIEAETREDESMTRTHLLTHTLISTTIETVTETVPRIITSSTRFIETTPQGATITPFAPKPNEDLSPNDGDSILVVMSDHQPPAADAEEVEAEYGTDEDDDLTGDRGKRPEDQEDDDDDNEATRDEQDPLGSNEIHRVLAGGILGAPAFPREPTVVGRCVPECRASKAEVCTEVDGNLRCVCRPGFARMFLDRPCKPIYTYTIRMGLDRIGQDPAAAYVPVLNETASVEYRRLFESTRDALDRTMMQSDLRDFYRGLRIAGFTTDTSSTGVQAHVQFSDNAEEAKFEEVVKKYLIGNNFSLGGTEVYAARDLDLVDASDFDECSVKEGGPYHDCSPHAACFNLRGSYQCSCREGWADLSENLPAYPGRVCSQAPLGCAACNNKGHCALNNNNGQEVCECFPWHTGQRCQINLKVLLIALVTTGIILLALLGACVGLACRGGSRRRGVRTGVARSSDRRAMIPGNNSRGDGSGDTSSEGSVASDHLPAIPHHVPHVLPAPPKMAAPLPPSKRHVVVSRRKDSNKDFVPISGVGGAGDEQRDRSLTVMIPRAKYRSAPQSPPLPVNNCTTGGANGNDNKHADNGSLVVDERKLIGYLEGGSRVPEERKPHGVHKRKDSSSRVETTPDTRRSSRNQCNAATPTPRNDGFTGPPSGALVSAGFQVSATVVSRSADLESTLARSCGETTVEPSTRMVRGDSLEFTNTREDGTTTPPPVAAETLACIPTTAASSTSTTTNQPPAKLLRLMSDLGDAGSTLARSCGETTIQLPTKMTNASNTRRSSREPRDNASDGHTMAERDVGGTLRMPAQRPPFYDPDTRSSDRESNFDSL